MKKIIVSLITLIVVVSAGYIAWIHSLRPAEKVTEKNHSDIEYYHCGMHPWITSDKPGKCPICGMNLVPVYKNASKQDTGIVQIDPAMMQNIGVKTERVTKRKLTHTIRSTGKVDYDETKQAYITTKFSGYIQKATLWSGNWIRKLRFHPTSCLRLDERYNRAALWRGFCRVYFADLNRTELFFVWNPRFFWKHRPTENTDILF